MGRAQRARRLPVLLVAWALLLSLSPAARATERVESDTAAQVAPPSAPPAPASPERSAAFPPPPDSQPAGPAADAGAPPDTVLLRDGSLFRGTLVERVMNSHVTLMLPAGDPRRFPMDRVAYAGPKEGLPAASSSPKAASQAAAARRDEADHVVLRFHADDDTTSLHVYSFMPESGRPDEHSFAADQRLCIGSCVISVPKGRYRFSVSGKHDHLELIPGSFDIHGDAKLSGEYHSHRGMRVGGWVLFGVSLPVGLLAAVDAETREGRILGAGVGLAGAIAGLVMALNFDDASLRQTPAAPRPRYPRAPGYRVAPRDTTGFFQGQGRYFTVGGTF